jgi:RNA polymerase sigma-70 factor (ECF subfamily)
MSLADSACAASENVLTDDNERELVAQAKQNPHAFAGLYRRYYQMLAAHVYRRTGDRHATEDVVADVFLTVLRVLPRYRCTGVPLRYWLLRIATNAANRWARRQRRWRRRSVPADELELAEVRSPSTADPIDAEHAQRALLSIAPKYQAVLALYYLEGLPVKDVADILGCRVGTVKSRLARARDALRAALA